MTYIPLAERCACGATFSVTGSTYRSDRGGGTNGQHRSAEEMAQAWRVEHIHEMPAVIPGDRTRRLAVVRPRVRFTAVRKPTESQTGDDRG